ncbi:MAG: NUDIX domain-containing protein [Candidatus Woesearchaeota archaeon]|nr:NUDIX domain-containing protein [Candidatus Woesearchaeota archaeon]
MDRVQIVDTILEKDGKVLMLIRKFDPGKGKLDLLGGFVDKGETIEEAAIREAKEESGLNVKLIGKLGTFDYLDREEKTANVFIGDVISGEVKNSIEGDLIWKDPKEVKSEHLAFPQLHLKVLQQYLQKGNLISP